MSKGELIASMAEEGGVSKANTEKILNAFLSQVEKALCARDKVRFTDFGSFEVKEHAERTDQNPKIDGPIMIPTGRMPVLKTSKISKGTIRQRSRRHNAAPT